MAEGPAMLITGKAAGLAPGPTRLSDLPQQQWSEHAGLRLCSQN
jgi:hypothetical protein